ncbi:MAG: uroporphyrinogen decarboxylase family protein [Verrucomicrobiota bacterium]|jgi:uroporphyrinogen-III decarboxylase
MNSKELVCAALMGRATARAPTGPLAVHFCAGVAGYTLRQYTTEAQALAESVIRYYERFKPDAVWVSADTWVSAQAMGASVGAEGDDQPFGGLGAPLVQRARDLERIPPPDPGSQGRWPLMLEACGRIVEALGREAYIVACFDQYPFSLAGALMGVQEVMLKVEDDPAFVRALMERCLEYGLAYARALRATGADMLSGGDSLAGLIGPRAYREVALPFEQRLIAGLKSAYPEPSGSGAGVSAGSVGSRARRPGGRRDACPTTTTTATAGPFMEPMGVETLEVEAARKPVSLHVCGNALPILADMASSGADVLEIDQKVELGRACQAVGSEIALWGNLDPVAVLAHGSVEQVRRAAQTALETVRACGRRRFVLSSGCTLAVETPAANLEALLRCDL